MKLNICYLYKLFEFFCLKISIAVNFNIFGFFVTYMKIEFIFEHSRRQKKLINVFKPLMLQLMNRSFKKI